jgi:urease accessory protein
MSVATSQSEHRAQQAQRLIEVHGVAEIGFVFKAGQTRLQHLYQSDPLRVLFPHHAAGDIPVAVISSTAGGLVGGDRLDIRLAVAEGCRAMATVQAAEKVYRSSGPDSHIAVELQADSGSWLEWLPQETILFEQARLRRMTKVHMAADARLLAGEMMVLGRLAGGEKFSEGLLRDAWEVRVDRRLIWADALLLKEDIPRVLDSPAGFAGQRVCATAIYVGSDATEHLELARELMGTPDDLKVGVTCMDGLLLMRWLGRDPLLLRQHFGAFWAEFRQQVGDLPGKLPRLWQI